MLKLQRENTEATCESRESVETTRGASRGRMLCSRCKLEKDVNSFPSAGKISVEKGWTRSRQGRHSWCRTCHRENMAIRLQAGYALLAKVKDQPCKDCGRKYPSCAMDFDHREGTIKRFCISECAANFSIESLKREVLKCDVVCANCHRIRTWNRRHPDAPILNPALNEDIVRTER